MKKVKFNYLIFRCLVCFCLLFSSKGSLLAQINYNEYKEVIKYTLRNASDSVWNMYYSFSGHESLYTISFIKDSIFIYSEKDSFEDYNKFKGILCFKRNRTKVQKLIRDYRISHTEEFSKISKLKLSLLKVEFNDGSRTYMPLREIDNSFLKELGFLFLTEVMDNPNADFKPIKYFRRNNPLKEYYFE